MAGIRFENIAANDAIINSKVNEMMETLGWDPADIIEVVVGGTAVSGIHQGEDYNKKWATPFGVRKYNKDAFIVIKNLDRNPIVPSQQNPDLKQHHE